MPTNQIVCTEPTFYNPETHFRERRSSPRKPLPYVVLVFFGQSHWGKLIDLSEGGMSFEFDQPPSLDEPTHFTFDAMGVLAEGTIFSDSSQLTGQAVWIREFERTVGVQFLDLGEKRLEQIRRWIAPETFQQDFLAGSKPSGEAAQTTSAGPVLQKTEASTSAEPIMKPAQSKQPDLDAKAAERRWESSQAPAAQILEHAAFDSSKNQRETNTKIAKKAMKLHLRLAQMAVSVVLICGLAFLAGVKVARSFTGRPQGNKGAVDPLAESARVNRAEKDSVAEKGRSLQVEVLDAENHRWLLSVDEEDHQSTPGSMAHTPALPETAANWKSKTDDSAANVANQAARDFRLIPPSVNRPKTNAPDGGTPAPPALLGETSTASGISLAPIVSNSAIQAPAVKNPRAGGHVQPAQLIRSIPPIYPQAARKARIMGDVTVDALIDEDGDVKNLKAISGPPLLFDAATAAVRQWKYEPARLNGRPTSMRLIVTVKFLVE